VVRAVGLDIHRDFCEVAILEGGELRSGSRVETSPPALELFAASLGREDWVALEVSGNAAEIARILERHVARVVVVSPSDTGIRQARAKTDRLDARTLARLLAAGSLDGVWMPDERTRVMRRRLARRAQLVTARSRSKNEIHAVLIRRLVVAPNRLEITAGAPKRQGRSGIFSTNDAMREAERALAEQAEHAYNNTVRDWQAAQAKKVGASATKGRASNKPSKGKAARQTTSP